jgi:type IV secretion system protein VirB10
VSWFARAATEQTVRGERAALVSGARDVQSRISSLLAATVMIALGVAALAWYYTHALTRRDAARRAVQSQTAVRAQGELPLPPLGKIELPAAPRAAEPPAPPHAAPVDPLPEARSLDTWNRANVSGAGAAAAVPAVPGKTLSELALERRLAGEVYAGTQSGASDAAATGPANTGPAAAAAAARRGAEGGASALAVALRPSVTDAAEAALLPDARFLLPKGAFIDCTLETAIDSTLPGMSTCITAADTFGADGKVVLLERGTKLVGETHGQVTQGQARVFVLWTQARTPAGVVVPLDSPGTDELGRAGLPGEVQRHFWQRFGAAMLVSLIDGAVQAGVQASSHAGGTVVYAPVGSQDVLSEVLKDTLRIAPTIVKHNGDRIQVLVARDLDFRPVYELRPADR